MPARQPRRTPWTVAQLQTPLPEAWDGCDLSKYRKPLYSELETRYQNRVRKSLLKLESRARRFEKSGEPLPEDLRGYMAMLQM